LTPLQLEGVAIAGVAAGLSAPWPGCFTPAPYRTFPSC